MIPEEIGAGGLPASSRLVCAQCGGRVSTTDKPVSKVTVALFELGLCAFGAGMAYYFAVQPYQLILRGEPLELYFWGLVLGGFFLCFGLGLIITTIDSTLRGTKTASKPAQWALVALMVAGCVAGFLGYFWLRQLARDHGYTF